jgi:hypothetical protein
MTPHLMPRAERGSYNDAAMKTNSPRLTVVVPPGVATPRSSINGVWDVRPYFATSSCTNFFRSANIW